MAFLFVVISSFFCFFLVFLCSDVYLFNNVNMYGAVAAFFSLEPAQTVLILDPTGVLGAGPLGPFWWVQHPPTM